MKYKAVGLPLIVLPFNTLICPLTISKILSNYDEVQHALCLLESHLDSPWKFHSYSAQERSKALRKE